MFGEADAINALTAELTRTLRESTTLVNSTLGKFRGDVVFAIMDSASTRDKHLRELTGAIEQLNKTLRRFFPVPTPGSLKITVIGESQMANMLGFKIVLPELPPEPNDIVGGEVTVIIGGGEPQIIPTTKDQVEIVDLSGEQGAQVQVSFVYIDDAGNKSEEASTLTETLVDTIPPATPGALGLAVTSEFTTEDTPPEPEPEPPV